MFIVAILIGFAAGFIVWLIGSYFIALFIKWGDDRPQPLSEKSSKVYEIALCGILFVITFAVFFLVAKAILDDAS